jgi:hypothetical protein
MTPFERELLKFLALHLRASLDDWTYQPTRGEIRQKLDDILRGLAQEESEALSKPE